VVRLDAEDERLRPGMSAEVEIVTEIRSEALWVPLEAVFRVGLDDIVYRSSDGGFVPAKVRLGPRNSSAVVVEEGLALGDVIATRRPAQYR